MTRTVERDHCRRRRFVAVAGLVLAAVVVGMTCAQTTLPASSSTYLRVIVVGATGDLAAKYLWVACFRLALKAWLTQGQRVVFIAAARESKEDGERWKRRFFTSKWAERVCGNATSDSSGQSDSCRSFYSNEFVPMIEYATLDSAAQYKALAHWVVQQDAQLREQGLTESGRLVYLAIPPRAFLPASTHLSKYLRPTEPNAFLRVVIEKPFGRDLASAEFLASGLRQVLGDEEMLLMDHYAGKPGLRVIDPFVRRNGATLARIWDGKSISKIEIQMSETETCEHRLDYFDRNGIIRDVMANHLQLLLGVVVSPSLKHCSSPTAPPKVAQDKLDDLCPHELSSFVRSLRPVGPVVIGQYEGYNSAAPHDRAHTSNRSVTATAAFAVLESSNSEWAGTTISIAAAKAMNARSADVKVTFKLDPAVNDFGQPCSVRFTIQNGLRSSGESIQVHCASLGALQVPATWSLDPSGEIVLSSTPQDSKAWQLGDPISAYDSLLHDAAHGHCDNFMKIEEVLAAWSLWSPIVHEAERISSESIISYPVGATTWMQFEGVTGSSNTCPVTTPWAPGSHPRRDVVDTDSAVLDT